MQALRTAPGELAGAARRISVPRVLSEYGVAIALGTLVLVQWLAILAFALTVRHNGWLYYQGGDQLWSYTTAWLLGDGRLPFTAVGFGWPFALLPIAAVAGPNFLDGLPAIVLLNVLVLMPAAVLALYGLGARLGGRAVGLTAATLWVVLPWLAVPLFEQDYHVKYVEQFLPQAMGLSAMSDLASTVALLVGALLTARALERDDAWAGAAAGIGAGLAVALKPSVALALPAFALALAVARRWRALAAAVAALGIPVLVLAIWKARGVGSLPLFERGEFQVAAGAGDVFAPVERYVDWSFAQLHRIERDFRGEFFSVRLLELTAIGGAIALGRRTLAGAFLVGGWFAAIVLVKGGSSLASIDSGSFFRYVMPAFPAFCILAASLLLLVPTLGGRLAAQGATRLPSRRASIAIVSACSAVFALAAVVTLLATQLRGDIHVVKVDASQPLIPVVDDLDPTISADGRRITLRWNPTAPTSADTFYRVFRSPKDEVNAPQDASCTDEGGSVYCTLFAPQAVGETREPVFSEETPEPGRWVYRVAVAGNWLDDLTQGDPVVISPPVEVTTT
jgi:hypothetical protein